MISTATELNAPMIFMHMRGNPKTMTSAEHTAYSEDPIRDIAAELNKQLDHADKCGLPRWLQMVDPGIGFAKEYDTNIALLKPTNLQRLKSLLHDRPMMVGASRKRFIGTIIDSKSKQQVGGLQRSSVPPTSAASSRDWGTAGVCCAAVQGGANILRVHNVKGIKDACDVFLTCIR
jgi:dihydropteroate synthase